MAALAATAATICSSSSSVDTDAVAFSHGAVACLPARYASMHLKGRTNSRAPTKRRVPGVKAYYVGSAGPTPLPPTASSQSSSPLVAERANFCLRPVFPFSEPCPDSRMLDRWVENAVVEIVKGLNDAPFLHFVFNSMGSQQQQQQQRHKVPYDALARPECWNYVKQSVFDSAPDGLIFVQRLDDELSRSVQEAALTGSTAGAAGACPKRDGLCLYRSTSAAGVPASASRPSATEFWGVLVQANNMVASGCYILQTTRVVPACGTVACTRFCLTRAQCYGPSLQAQLERVWLVQ